MRFYGRAEEAASKILDAFRRPESLPAALAPIFLKRKEEVPCRSWSWSNQLLVVLHGHADARGFRQWEKIGRKVRKGERGFPILAPILKQVEVELANGDSTTRTALCGFRHAIVFGLSQTEGEPVPPPDAEVARWIDNLPLLAVAREWGIAVETFSGRPGGMLGTFSHDGRIALGVENLATWCHELVHAADDRLGNLTERGQHWRSETVAELGAATLLTILGSEVEADLGGCWEYVRAYADAAGIETIAACQTVLKRTCDAVALILDAAEELAIDDRQTSERLHHA